MEFGGKCQRDKIIAMVFDNFPYRKSDVICISSSGSFPCTWNSSKIRGRILSWSIQNPRQQKWRGIYYRENAHAWVEVYFDGVGWKAVDVTPGYYYNVATLQKMVNTPEQIKKNAAMILLGAVTVLVIAGFILFVILEIRLWLLEQTLKKQYEQADMD